jgi:hypothetical protein
MLSEEEESKYQLWCELDQSKIDFAICACEYIGRVGGDTVRVGTARLFLD